MKLALTDTVVVRTLVGLLLFGALSAAVGAGIALVANGAGVPVAYLEDSPFSSYLVPGLILGVVVGGTQLCAAISLLVRGGRGMLLAAVAGFGMQIWIFAELAILREYSPLQTAYFALGALELILVLVRLGVADSPDVKRL